MFNLRQTTKEEGVKIFKITAVGWWFVCRRVIPTSDFGLNWTGMTLFYRVLILGYYKFKKVYAFWSWSGQV